MILRFLLAVEPRSLQTSGKRMAVRQGRPMFFRSKGAEAFRQSVTMLAAPHRPRLPLDGALRATFDFILPRPLELCRRSVPPCRLLCPKRPDVDNLIKALADVLTESRFWHDDGQLADVRIRKFYAGVDEKSHIEVEIEALAAYSRTADQLQPEESRRSNKLT